jgi:Uma2 family endonuclease
VLAWFRYGTGIVARTTGGRSLAARYRHGRHLGWLLDPATKQVHTYQPGAPVELLDDPVTLSAQPLLRGFVLEVRQMWAEMERKKS